MTTWVTSDWHLGHASILKYQPNRMADMLGKNEDEAEYFRTQADRTELAALGAECDDILLKHVSEMVSPGDELWHLGDFALAPRADCVDYLIRVIEMGVRLHLLPGNHDGSRLRGKMLLAAVQAAHAFAVVDDPSVFNRIYHMPEVHPALLVRRFQAGDPENPAKITLCHYPLEIWPGMCHRPDARGGDPDEGLHLHGHSHGNGRKVKDRLDVGIDAHGYLLTMEQAVELARANG